MRLRIEDLLQAEISDVQYLYEISSNMKLWDGRDPDPLYINRCYFQGDLPPDGQKENYKIQTIKRDTGLIRGII